MLRSDFSFCCLRYVRIYVASTSVSLVGDSVADSTSSSLTEVDEMSNSSETSVDASSDAENLRLKEQISELESQIKKLSEVMRCVVSRYIFLCFVPFHHNSCICEFGTIL